MIEPDKELIKQRFKKSLSTYDKNAVVQREMATQLVEFLPKKEFNSILEVGCGTGFLTKEIKDKIKYKMYFANDIVHECKQYIDEILPSKIFLGCDIENTELGGKFDLIIANASLQWTKNLNGLISKLINSLNDGGILAFSIFGDQNFNEIKTLMNITLENNLDRNILSKQVCQSCKIITFEEKIRKLEFTNTHDVLQHIKLTGVNAITEYKWTKSSLEQFEKQYAELFSTGEKVTLTYNPVYIVLQTL